MTDSNPDTDTTRRTEAGPSSDNGGEDDDHDSTEDTSGPPTTGSLSRRGALTLLTALGLGSVAAGNASAHHAGHDHLGELWDGSPGTGRGLETVLREKGQALKGTAGTNTDDTNDIGVKGTTYSTRGIGLEGLAAADSGNTIGLKGRTDSPDGTALFGEARNSNPGSSLAVEGLSRADDGTAVQGYAEAAGNTVGVEGRVDSADGYGLFTPDDAKIEGVLETQADWRVLVDGDRGLTLGGTAADDRGNTAGGNVIAGHPDNDASGAVGATVGGGGSSGSQSVGGSSRANTNEVSANYGTIGGGLNNRATGVEAVIGGGEQNTASAENATVAGGDENTASAIAATVSGGGFNAASGRLSTVGGGSFNDGRAGWATIAGGGPSDPDNPTATNNVVYDEYGTVGGGGANQAGSDDGDPTTARFATVGGGVKNTASSDSATVGGGAGNTASGYRATVGGGDRNTASGSQATVGGGVFNTASGDDATVAGGFDNTASGTDSTVPGGNSGKAANAYTFVWNDGTEYHDFDGDGDLDGLSSSKDVAGSGVTGSDTFHASAQGGFRFVTGDSSVTYISNGSTGWATTSTRAAKTNVDPVAPQEVLAGVEELEVATWEYKDGDGGGEGVRHMGPMAEAFHSAFDLGSSDTGINSINADGVAFAAIQGLSKQLEKKADRIEELETENERLHERLGAIEDRIADIEADGSAAPAADD